MTFKPSTRAFGLLRRRRLGEDGVSAVEFALIAPVLFLSLLAMVDLGLAVHQRMTIDHILRAGAQFAMEDPGEAAIEDRLYATAQQNFPLASGAEPDGIKTPTFDVDYICACPETDGPVACSTSCDGPTATSIYYNLEAEKIYEGMIFNGGRSFGRDWMTITLAPALQVQVR